MPTRVVAPAMPEMSRKRISARPLTQGRGRRHAGRIPALRAVMLAVAALGPLAAMPATAATCTWNATIGNWAAIVNWTACVTGNGNPGGAPGAADAATIGTAGVVTINTGQQIRTLNNAGQINIDAFGLNLVGGGSTTNTGVINVGGANTANMGVSVGHDLSNSGGVINIANGSVVNQFGSAITGGTINTTGSGALVAFASAANFLNGVTLGGRMDMASAFALQRVTNGLTLNSGTVEIANQSVLSFEGTSTLAGNGTIVLGSVGGLSNRIYFDGNGITTFAAGTTVRGHSGSIGGQINIGGTQTLVNNGTVNAELAGGTISFTESALVNNGLVRAQAGTMNVGVALSGSGSLQVDATGVMNLGAGAKTQGTLAMGAVGAALNLNTGNLTLSGDYTNAGWGSGNSFNRRAGVTGAALIVAGGNAAQTITGSNVTAGNTVNATLSIGNVRVGATTFNYRRANAGTPGPTLRGAIQTGVNGANLTDARLGGAGVTPGLFNAGAPGGSGGSLGVSFSVASAGPIAPLTGQVLNLRSNFENIADQRLNIVVGSGAAACNAAVGSATPTPVQLAAQRVGGSLSQVLTVTNTGPASAFSEDLNASFSGVTGGASGAGSISGRTAGSSSSGLGSMSVGLDTSTSGAKSGTATLAYATAGAVAGVSNGLGVAPAGTQAITVSGNVYAPAVAQLNTPAVNFGIVRVGDAVAPRSVSVSNTASGALTDTLRASFSGGASPFTAGGTAASVAAGGSNGSSLSVALNTATAGVYGSSGSVAFTSQNPEMADLPLAAGSVAFTATVNNLAATTLSHAGAGSFSGGLLSYTLNFGTVFTGVAGGTATLNLSNSATGPADALAGTFNLAAIVAGDPFALGGFTGFAGLAAGSSLGNLMISFGGTVEGNFDRVIVLNRLSTNGSGPDLGLAPVELRMVGTVTAVPEPGTWAMWLAGLAMVGSLMRCQTRAMRA